MKGIIVGIIVVALFGMVWYLDLIPLKSQSESLGLTPITEKVQQITDAIFPTDDKTIYYSIQKIPDVPDSDIPISALNIAINQWESANPGMKFVKSDTPNIEIRWQKFASSTHTGLATCNTVLFGIFSHCILDISIGVEDCHGNFVQNDENMVANILMHEIGHALGLGHTAEEGHLMYSTINPEFPFNTQGYEIPNQLQELYVGQQGLLQEQNTILEEISTLETKISRTESQYEGYLKQYQYYEGKTLSNDEYQKTQRAYDVLSRETDKLNSIIEEQNQLISRYNEIIKELGCSPNFEISF